MIDEVRRWSQKAELPLCRFIGWLGIATSKFYSWLDRYGKANEHNGPVARGFWLESWEKEAILRYQAEHPLEGYRRLAFMMLDENVVAVSPSSVWRVLHEQGRLHRWGRTRTQGKGFQQPLGPHEHWHIDIAYVNVAGAFYYLVSILDGYSRFIVAWDLLPTMTEADVEIVVQRAGELYPDARPRIISDNGSQFIARDFKELLRLLQMTHVRTGPAHPQSNGKLERYHRSVKSEAIREKVPLSLEEARRIIAEYVEYYNARRLHSAIGYVAPLDKLRGREPEIFALRDQRLEQARAQRQAKRQAARSACVVPSPVIEPLVPSETEARWTGESPDQGITRRGTSA